MPFYPTSPQMVLPFPLTEIHHSDTKLSACPSGCGWKLPSPVFPPPDSQFYGAAVAYMYEIGLLWLRL